MYTELLPKFGELIPVKDFILYCRESHFTDYDGWGRLVKDGLMCITTKVWPSNTWSIDPAATHIMWFSR